jgi:DNA-binding phage protein
MPTGASRYFAERASEPGYAEAYTEAGRRIDAVDRLMKELDERRIELGISKAELARRAELAPEAVRRLFTVDDPNPTISTLSALADALDLDLVPTQRRAG